MAHIVTDLIANARAQFADESHSALTNAHGHHFLAVRAPPKRKRQAAEREPESEAEAEPDTEALLAQKQQKIATHNARINALNNSKAREAEETP